MNEDKKKEFEKLAREIMKFLCDNCHPHTHVVIDCNTAELSEGVVAFQTDEYIKGQTHNDKLSRPLPHWADEFNENRHAAAGRLE